MEPAPQHLVDVRYARRHNFTAVILSMFRRDEARKYLQAPSQDDVIMMALTKSTPRIFVTMSWRRVLPYPTGKMLSRMTPCAMLSSWTSVGAPFNTILEQERRGSHPCEDFFKGQHLSSKPQGCFGH